MSPDRETIITADIVYTVKKGLQIFLSPAGMSLKNSRWPGIFFILLAGESLPSDIPAEDGEIVTFFYSVSSRARMLEVSKVNVRNCNAPYGENKEKRKRIIKGEAVVLLPILKGLESRS